MSLNIKDEETHRLASKLARLTGESMTLAVKVSLKERLERQELSQESAGRLERIRRIVERTAPLFQDGRSGNEMIEDLYDAETGLPK